jgi:hypothetical protein
MTTEITVEQMIQSLRHGQKRIDQAILSCNWKQTKAIYEKDIANIEAAIETLERLRWMPIETAPKDGSHIQLYRPEIQFVGYYGGANSGWRINAPDLPALWPLPTHWMPLPPKD